MKTGMALWLICSAICFNSLVNGQLALATYFLVLSCVLPVYIAKQMARRRLPR